jgi:hypothetical protein
MEDKKKGLPDLTKLPRGELTQLLDELTVDLRSINLQISTARAKARTDGKYADSEWWYRVNKASIVVGSYVKRVERELGKRKEQARSTSLADFFVQAAKFHLQPDSFEMIMRDAKTRMEVAQE